MLLQSYSNFPTLGQTLANRVLTAMIRHHLPHLTIAGVVSYIAKPRAPYHDVSSSQIETQEYGNNDGGRRPRVGPNQL